MYLIIFFIASTFSFNTFLIPPVKTASSSLLIEWIDIDILVNQFDTDCFKNLLSQNLLQLEITSIFLNHLPFANIIKSKNLV
ncbi:hypothetical protein HOB94_07635 [bacterium]|nr:hypothetical protein [bacterium]MBT6778692.1 hypothetical protein [bacterium]